MAISEDYSDTLKRRAVARFIEENDRSPTRAELIDLVRREKRRYPSVDEVGIVGFDMEKPQYTDVSSVSVENKNRTALFDDMSTISTRLSSLVQLLEDSFRGFQATGRRTKKILTQLENRLDNLLLLQDQGDAFVYGIEEDFRTQEAIDIDRTTASVETNYCVMGRTGYTPIDLERVKFSATATAQKGTIGSESSESLDMLRTEDGSYWEHLVYTRSRQGRVSVVLEFEMEEPLYVGDVRIVGNPVSVNQKTTATLFYSLDGQSFVALEPVERVFQDDEMQFNVGIDGVQVIQISLSKNASDAVTATGNQFVTIFSLDTVKIYSDRYVDDKESVLYAGPYEVVDEMGEPVYFTKATCTACAVIPDDTDISYFLSKDGINYVPVDPESRSLGVVSFANGAKAGSEKRIDPLRRDGSLEESATGLEEVDFLTEAIINVGVAKAFAPLVPTQSIVIKRNIPTGETVYKAPSGWFFDADTATYTTTVYVGAPEGRYIDVGHTGITVNGNLLSGRVHLQPGYSVIQTDDGNWSEVPTGLTSTDAIINADPYYPYNHKYLIEGYPYPDNFTGNRIYNGVDEYFGALMVYVPPEKFNAFEGAPDRSGTGSQDPLWWFTIEETDGNKYFKIKVDKSDASWSLEEYELDWLVQADTSNEIYMKAILSTTDSDLSPILQSFGVRVI